MKWLAGQAPQFDVLPDKKGVWRLEIGTADARDSIAVFIDNRKVGRLSGTKTLAYASLLDRLDAPVVFRGAPNGRSPLG